MSIPEFLAPEHAEYAFGTRTHGWSGFAVVDFHAIEGISEPFRYVITLMRRAGDPTPLDSLLDADATLAIAARSEPGFFVRHGFVEAAEELERTSEIILYRVVLAPAAARARYRQRCRTFNEKTLREIVTSVLKNESVRHPRGFEGLVAQDADPGRPELLAAPTGPVSPMASFRWDIRDAETNDRLDDRVLRRYVVQYNESDYDFVARLLEEEGISYFYEHDAGGATMWLTDQPGRQSLFAARRTAQSVRFQSHSGGLGADEDQVVHTFLEALRMRSAAVTMRDWSWVRSHVVLEGRARSSSGDDDRSGHFAFPGRDDGRAAQPCVHPADVRLERFTVEKNLSEGRANVRGLCAGRRIAMTDHGGPADGYLLCRIETVAVQLEIGGTVLDELPFGFEGRSARKRRHESRFQALRADVRFRPAMATPKPRIDGVQSAVVTDEDGTPTPPPEINSDSIGRVRVRFPWDQRDDGTPSSKWLRVSQYWAGAGFGALYTPRVGQEVLVAFTEGDPDRPTVVGRVYNTTHPLPIQNYDQHLEQSTIRSQSTPNATGHNEILFDDRAGHECFRVHAQRDMVETVLHDHRLNVHHNESISVSGSQSISVGGDQSTTVGGTQRNTVDQDQIVDIRGHINVTSGGFHNDSAAANREIRATNFYVETGPNQDGAAGDIQLKSGTAAWWQQEEFVIHVGSAFIRVLPGLIELNTGAGASIRLVGAAINTDSSGDTTMRGAHILLNP
jgi:type VI secretion system secreted protein VgrG